MGAYRLYFLNQVGQVIGAEVFDAANEIEAKAMGTILADACSDLAHGFELWQANNCVHSESNGTVVAIPEQIERIRSMHQESIVRFEERLASSSSRLAKSERLLSSLEAAKSRKPGP